MRTVVPAIALICGLAATPALALDYRVASRTEAGLGLVDADTVTVVGENRRVQITAVLPPETGEEAVVMVGGAAATACCSFHCHHSLRPPGFQV